MAKTPLLNLQSEWVTQTFKSLTLEQKVGQLLHPFVMPARGIDTAIEALDGVEVGGLFFFTESKEKLRELSHRVQSTSAVPIIVSSDLENGAGRMVDGAVVFPDNMGIAATNKPENAYVLGEAAAKEGREVGIHWAFGPVVDINENPNNPITNTRSFGDDQPKIEKFGLQMIAGMQDHGMAACAKHFPGDGMDDRDQHLCTSINPKSFDDWEKTSGALFQTMIDQGVWSIMMGHIALPSVDPGTTGKLRDAPPAPISYKLTTELLREKMGFEGVIITDAIGMGGSCTHYPESEIVVRSIEAGCDMVLFCQARESFDAIMAAVNSGRISEKRIDESVLRLLALKEKLNLNNNSDVVDCTESDKERFKISSQQFAQQALTLVQNHQPADALPLKPGMKVLSMHLRGDPVYNVDSIDDQLRERDIEVTRWDETMPAHPSDWKDVGRFDALLVHTVFGPTWSTNRIRLSGNFNRALVEVMKTHHPRLVMTSFGNPYQLYEYPRCPMYLNAYSPDASSQRAYVEYLFGEKATGVLPVNLDKLLNGL